MILFHLICGQEHEFEGWFRNGATFDEQLAAGELTCPVCSNRSVRKAPMSPGVISGERAEKGKRDADAELRESLIALRRTIEENCDYVGERFPEEARRIHYGEVEERPIYGQTSLDEARSLREEGVDIMLIPGRPRRDS
ncbi:DUF1178 family protein [Telmatospirillum siberiense]|uniref:DUF1178 domain-containing protein n=1 Tax=Telmatospirillum siberiense TaxID=382514 RepID=A0A2N3Q190_9PROT|nr:DUF1178 family protein [Telmatospirillum siberiense]PKU26428.1 DUF1178 domain-containing protein [Telmatospirillum siberiense]